MKAQKRGGCVLDNYKVVNTEAVCSSTRLKEKLLGKFLVGPDRVASLGE